MTGASQLEHGLREVGVLLRFWQANPPVYYREVQRNLGPTESLEMEEKESKRSQISQDFG